MNINHMRNPLAPHGPKLSEGFRQREDLTRTADRILRGDVFGADRQWLLADVVCHWLDHDPHAHRTLTAAIAAGSTGCILADAGFCDALEKVARMAAGVGCVA